MAHARGISAGPALRLHLRAAKAVRRSPPPTSPPTAVCLNPLRPPHPTDPRHPPCLPQPPLPARPPHLTNPPCAPRLPYPPRPPLLPGLPRPPSSPHPHHPPGCRGGSPPSPPQPPSSAVCLNRKSNQPGCPSSPVRALIAPAAAFPRIALSRAMSAPRHFPSLGRRC